MRSVSAGIILLIVLFNVTMASGQNTWTLVDKQQEVKGNSSIAIDRYFLYTLNESVLNSQLRNTSDVPLQGQLMQLPLPDGTMRSFKVRETPMMPDQLAAKYPELRTYTGVATDDERVTAKLDHTAYGFHAMIFDGDHTSFVDPYDNTNSGYYIVHYKADERTQSIVSTHCMVRRDGTGKEEQPVQLERKRGAAKTVNGSQLLTYRLALACDHEYAIASTGAASPTIAQVISKMLTSMNRINGLYERELSVTMNFVANEDTLIWTAATGGINGVDPFNGNDNLAAVCNTINQATCDNRIGNANYDIGHVFTTGAGGFSQVGCVCRTTVKAQSSTGRPNPVGDGFDIDFVAHEIGHEFGANHTFNNGSDDNCGDNNRYQETAYEPGSGSTLMAYAGICSPDNIQPHSDDYFHTASLIEIQNFIASFGGACAVKTTLNNNPRSVPSFSWSYDIPYLTPFELTPPDATGTDTSVSYCWEEWDLSIAGERLEDTHAEGPLFRSYGPVKSVTRVFPKIDMVLAQVLSNAGKNNAEGEKVPDVSRKMIFKLTVRNIVDGRGAFTVPDDSINLNVVNTGEGFKVTSQNTSGSIYNGNSTQHISWNVVGTDQVPVNTPNVDIYMSADGGYTWPYHIGRYVNNGGADVTLPNPDTTISAARIKVKGADNVFFNVNSNNFSVVHSDAGDTDIQIRPVPVHSVLRVSSGNKGALQTTVFNAIGQAIWNGEVNGELDMRVAYWARGIYLIRFVDVKGKRTVMKFVVD
ncbi:MAG: hypothetical protein JWQ38_3137 [Flavipsychrobacter sp.]|nr:hypothetical protein [Flavipsychrobacter sp.]